MTEINHCSEDRCPAYDNGKCKIETCFFIDPFEALNQIRDQGNQK